VSLPPSPLSAGCGGSWPLSPCCGPHTSQTFIHNISSYPHLAFPTRLITSLSYTHPQPSMSHTATYPFRPIQHAGGEQGFYSRPN
jgi:hypothetical protein